MTQDRFNGFRRRWGGAFSFVFSSVGFFWIFLFFGFFSGNAFSAGNLGDAEAALSNAHNKYFEALMSGKGGTPAEDRRLREQIIIPAASNVNRVIEERNNAFLRQIGAEPLPPVQFKRELEAAERADATWKDRDKPVTGIMDFAQKFFGDDLNAPTDASGPAVGSRSLSSGSSSRNSVIIDGSNVPRVLEFPGPKKKPLEEFPLSP